MYDLLNRSNDTLDMHRKLRNEENESRDRQPALADAKDAASENSLATTLHLEGLNKKNKTVVPHLVDFIDATSLSNADIESTWEYQQYMNPGKKWQKDMKLTSEEATLACLQMLQAMKDKQKIDFKKDGEDFALAARNRLKTPDLKNPAVQERLGTEINVLTEERAKEVFLELSQSEFVSPYEKLDKIPFNYSTDGCYARAFFMEQRLTALGIASQKIFVVATNWGEDLVVDDDKAAGIKQNPPEQQAQTRWGYHVAPIIKVLIEGKEVDMVFDPSLGTEPVTVEQWESKMSAGKEPKFTTMTLDEVKKLKADKGGYDLKFADAGNIAFQTDRDSYDYDDLLDKPKDKKDKENEMVNSRVMMALYLDQQPAYELAAVMRKQIKDPKTLDPALILAEVQKLTDDQRFTFWIEFDKLLGLYETLVPADDFKKIKDALHK